MYYRIAIQRERDQPNPPPSWQWKSTVLSSREGQQEQFMQENQGLGSASVTTAQFLQTRMIQSGGVTPAYGSREHQGTVSIVVSTKIRLDERSRAAPSLDEKYEFAREAAARARAGTGGDHDVPYGFALPLSMTQVFACIRLLTRVHRGELQP